jgi:hypothetical protein
MSYTMEISKHTIEKYEYYCITSRDSRLAVGHTLVISIEDSPNYSMHLRPAYNPIN